MKVIHVRRRHQPVHGGIDRWCRSPPPVQAVVEHRDHLVFLILTGVHLHQRTHPIHAKNRQPRLGQRPEVPTRALDPHNFRLGSVHRIDQRTLGRRIAPREVGVASVRAEAVGAGKQFGHRRRRHGVLLESVL